MPDKSIIYTKKEHIAYITLNSPDTGNRLGPSLAQELAETCSHINGDKDIYLTIITGAGESFCKGGDLRSQFRQEMMGEVPAVLSPAEAVAQINHPTLAAVNGDAVGEGLELALACDLRIASDAAHFGLPQVTEGWIPMDGGTQRLSRIVGKGKALELVLTGEIIDAPAAFEIGLINKLVSPDNLMSEVEALSKTITAKAPFSLLYAKEAVNKGLDMTLEQGLRLEADLYFLLHTTADRTEGVTSFLQKKQPQYKGE